MTKAKTNLHLEIQYASTKPVGILRSSYRQGGKIKHTQFGRIKDRTLEELKMLQLAFRNKVTASDDPESFQIVQSREYGASSAILKLARSLGLQRILSYKEEGWVNSVLAMIAGRIVYAGSKLMLSHQGTNSSLWNLANIDEVDVNKHCYQAMDKLLENQNLIQKKLAKKHLRDGHLILYDITSSYLEGEYSDSELVKDGYNRDLKKGHAQVVIGLLCSKEGCPVGVEVYPGNTKDETTVIGKIKEIKSKYDIKKVIFVGDRGMVTSSNIEKLKDQEDVFTISALTRNQIFELLKNNTIQPSLFDEHNIHEVIDSKDPSKRYCLCKNPLSKDRDKATRDRLLELTQESLTIISNYKQKTTAAILGSRIGKILNKYKMGKFLDWNIHPDHESRYGLYTMLKYKEDKVAKSVQEHDFVIIKSDKANGYNLHVRLDEEKAKEEANKKKGLIIYCSDADSMFKFYNGKTHKFIPVEDITDREVKKYAGELVKKLSGADIKYEGKESISQLIDLEKFSAITSYGGCTQANRVFYLNWNNKVSELKREKYAQYKILTKIEEIKITHNKKYQPDDFGLELNKFKDLVSHLGCVHKESKSKNHKVIWKINKEAVQKAELLDGCYIISSNVSSQDINTNEIVASYKKLGLVETAFRNLKTVSLEMRPIYHKTDYRIKAHVFLCMLAYYLQWHMAQRLKPLFANDGKGKERKWTFASVILTLRQITENKISLKGTNFTKISNPTIEQKQILDLLEIKL